MSVSAWDGRFALECWEANSEDDEGHCEYGDDIEVLRARAEKLIAAGRYVYIELTAYDAATGEWGEPEVYETLVLFRLLRPCNLSGAVACEILIELHHGLR